MTADLAPIPSGLSDASMLAVIVNRVCRTEMVAAPLRGREAECFAVALRAHELGVPVMQALGGDLFVINGRVGMSAELMRALAMRAGHRIDLELADDAATAAGTRGDSGATCTVTWTLADAKRAGLRHGVWDKYPRAMLAARATSELCRMLFPDVLRGVSYTAEELRSINPERNVVPAEAVEVDWHELGWADATEHDTARATLADAAADLPDDVRDQLRTEWAQRGLRWPLSAEQASGWAQVLREAQNATQGPPDDADA